MNKGYRYLDGKILVSDEKGNYRIIDYHENLDQILLHENLLEFINNKINTLEKEKNSYYEEDAKYFPEAALLLTGGSLILSPVVAIIMGDPDSFTSLTMPLIGNVDFLIGFTSMIFTVILPISAVFTTAEYESFDRSRRERRGINAQLKFLYSEREKEEKIISDLVNSRSKYTKIKNFGSKTVQDEDKLAYYKDSLSLINDIAYYNKDFRKYYEKGNLYEKLNNNYPDSAIEYINNYFEEQDKALVKSK